MVALVPPSSTLMVRSGKFLSDTTGTRRWLPFEVESIESPLTQPFDHDAIFAQAYALYRQGFRYWFDRPEIERLQRHNEAFEAPNMECELVDIYFRKPVDGELGEFMPVSRALQIIGGNITRELSDRKIGRAFMDLGFRFKRTNTSRGYVVVQRSAVEIKERLHLQASDEVTL